jgi:galactokinase
VHDELGGRLVTAVGAARGAVWLFAERYGREPDGVWYAPGRVNLIGEHTDYNEGFALPFAISAGVYVAAAARDDGVVAATSRQHGETVVTVPVATLAPGRVDGWAAYPAGMAWALLSAGHRVGAGLSSSAALECASGLALADLYQLALRRPELAALGRRAENEFVGAPTGLMDQLAVLLCEAGHALLLDCRAGTGTSVPLDTAAAGLVLLVIDTRVQHELTDGGYGSRRRACEHAAHALGVRSLRDIAEVGLLDRLGDPVLRRRARHVVTENRRVLQTVELLRAGQLSDVGSLLTESHASLRYDFAVSWPEADAAVEAAIEAGAYGARMTGGGFGGSVIALAPAGVAAAVTAEVEARFARRGWRAPAVTRTQPSQSAHKLLLY